MEVQDITKGSVHSDWYLCDLARKELTDKWILTKSVWPSLFFVAAYLLFVKQIGPRLMKDRKPFNLKPLVLLFNLTQCILNTYMWTTVLEGARWRHILENSCHPAENIDLGQCRKDCNLIWLYYVTKLTDLLDTVFFILKKKKSQVTFLHIYHHSIMVPGTWYFGLTLTGSQMIIVGGINSLIHTIMYTYYFLSAIGPSMQKYLWWKIYVTRLQMLQFFTVLAYMIFLLMNQCSLPAEMTYFLIVFTTVFIILFLNFYIQSYIRRRKKLDNISETIPAHIKNKPLHEKGS